MNAHTHEGPQTPPYTLPIVADAIPPELRSLPHWVAWKWEWIVETAKWTKVPINALTGFNASPTNSRHWTSFSDALAYADFHGCAGVGFVVTRDDPFTGIDLDKCRDLATGQIESWAADIVAEFDSYTEITPSGTGLRIWVIGTLIGSIPDGKEGKRKGKIEVYSGSHYLTVTGQLLKGGQQ